MILELKSFEMIEKADYPGGYQCVLEFNDYTQLSIISGKGAAGHADAPYEVAVFVKGKIVRMPGITGYGITGYEKDGVRGFLTEADVDAIIKKMYLLTGKTPEQV